MGHFIDLAVFGVDVGLKAGSVLLFLEFGIVTA